MAITVKFMMRQTTEPKNVSPLAELSTLEMVLALLIPLPSALQGEVDTLSAGRPPGLQHGVDHKGDGVRYYGEEHAVNEPLCL
jgi:hypothetical protein